MPALGSSLIWKRPSHPSECPGRFGKAAPPLAIHEIRQHMHDMLPPPALDRTFSAFFNRLGKAGLHPIIGCRWLRLDHIAEGGCTVGRCAVGFRGLGLGRLPVLNPGPSEPQMSYQPPQYPQNQNQNPSPAYFSASAPIPQQPTSFAPQFLPPAPPKKKRGKTVLIVAGSVAGVLLTLCLVGAIAGGARSGTATVAPPVVAQGATAPPRTSKPKLPATFNVALGSTITITGEDDSEAKGTIRSAKTYRKACEDFMPDPKNATFVVVDVVVEQTKGTGSVNPLDFTFVADDDTTASGLSAAMSGCDTPSLDSSNSLQAGQKRAGKIAFDATSGSGTVEWAPGGLGAKTVGSWKIS